ncbi:MAG: hypothetical protein RL297_1701 [Pseudomonadota bacterium]|jgi:uncharacterized protein (DUF1501 family)
MTSSILHRRSLQLDASRRLFLRQASALTAVAGAGAPLALNLLAAGSAAAAQTASDDYKAVVCVFLFGGNDAFNMVLPTDTASWQAYSTTRNQAPDPIALLAPGTTPNTGADVGSPARLGGVLPITPLNAQSRSFALHPLMGGLQTLFNTDKRLAILPNIGPLKRPTTKAQFGNPNHPKPAGLFSHNDQQNVWQSLASEGATLGWGGRMADAVASQNTRSTFTAVSASGNAVWLSGQDVRQYQVSTGGAIRVGADANGRVYGSTDVAAALDRVIRGRPGGHVFETDLSAVSGRAVDAEAFLRTALKPASDPLFSASLQYTNPLTGVATANGLAQQLQVVARMIEAGARGATGARRQVFFVSLGGFDTHAGQNRTHTDLMARLAQALSYFDTTLGGLGLLNNVTTFTASDFGRTFTSNGNGTDHGWGAHQFVMGGAVRGGDLYGRFPTLALKNTKNNHFDGSTDQLSNGSLLPGTSVDQLGATLGRWFGLSDGQIGDIFPNLSYFNAEARNLGFIKTLKTG